MLLSPPMPPASPASRSRDTDPAAFQSVAARADLSDLAPSSFAASATTVLTSLRGATAHIVSRLPGRITTATDLKRALNVDYSLCWRLFELLKAENPLNAAHQIPSQTSLRRFADAAKSRGLSADVILPFRQAASDFQSLIGQHASSRPAFNAMIAALVHEDDASVATLQQRKATFLGETELWGASIATQFKTLALQRNPDGSFTGAKIAAKLGFQRLRADVRPIILGMAKNAPDLDPEHLLDPSTQLNQPGGLLPQFCSSPIPDMELIHSHDNWRYLVLASEQLGRLGAADLVSGNKFFNQFPDQTSTGRTVYTIGTRFVTPAEYAVQELLLHIPSCGNLVPKFRVVPDIGLSINEDAMLPAAQFPAYGKLHDLGPADKTPPPTGVPRYPEMLAKLYTSMNWNPADFRAYRVTMDYPIFRTIAAIWLDLTPP